MTSNSNYQSLLLASKPNLHQHVEALLSDMNDCLEALRTLREKGVLNNLSQATKGTVLAALQMTGNGKIITPALLAQCDVVAIVKACEILDRPRFIKQLEQRKIAPIEQRYPHLVEAESAKEDEAPAPRKFKGRHGKKKDALDSEDALKKRTRKRKVDVYRSKVRTARALMRSSAGDGEESAASNEIIASASLSGAFARKIRRWAKTLDASFLEFIVMSNAFEYWKRLADWVHFSPKDFSLPYFLSVVHGEGVPEGSFVFGMRSLTSAPVGELGKRFTALAEKFPQVYESFNFLRTQDNILRCKEIATMLARNVPLSTVIWYLEEIAQSDPVAIPKIVTHRLKAENWMDVSSKVSTSFGKLLERILTFSEKGWNDVADELKPAAERTLSSLKEKWGRDAEEEEGLTVVFVDKSGSMYTAIKAGSIIGAMLSACFQAELSFFDSDPVDSPHKRPQSVEHVLDIVKAINADNATSMAAALWPYFESKKKIARIFLVSDEGENTSYPRTSRSNMWDSRNNGHMFGELLKMYKDEVYSGVEMISICVDSGDSRFRDSMTQRGIDCKRIEIDGYRPDLSKFDSLVGQIALLSQAYSSEEEEKEQATGQVQELMDETNEETDEPNRADTAGFVMVDG